MEEDAVDRPGTARRLSGSRRVRGPTRGRTGPSAGGRGGDAPALPLVQFEERAGIIDLAWGHPDPAMLPVAALRSACASVLDRFGADALAYGHAAGPGPLLSWVCERLAVVDARAPQLASVMATGGISQALDQVLTLLARPGDVVLVESPTYHLAVRIMRDHPVELVPVGVDGKGLRVDSLRGVLAGLARTGRRPRLLYTIPTFHNPTGVSMAPERRHALVDLAADEGILVVEDDAYRELSYDGPAPPSLWSMAAPGTVIRLGSFAKSLAPGLRSGFLTADEALVSRFRESGLLDSGGSVSHFTSLVVAEVGRSGDYAANVDRLRRSLAQRRDALLEALEAGMAAVARWDRPGGGYFVWLTLDAGWDVRSLLRASERHGTSFVPGHIFRVDRQAGPSALRLAFSRYPPDELREAIRRLGAAVRETAP